jgi:hypothetical protein
MCTRHDTTLFLLVKTKKPLSNRNPKYRTDFSAHRPKAPDCDNPCILRLQGFSVAFSDWTWQAEVGERFAGRNMGGVTFTFVIHF